MPARARESGCALLRDRKSTRLNSSHDQISYAVFCLKKKKTSTSTGVEVYRPTATRQRTLAKHRRRMWMSDESHTHSHNHVSARSNTPSMGQRCHHS